MTTTDIGRLKVWDFLARKFPDLDQRGPVIELPDCGRDDLALWFAEAGYRYGVEVGTEYGYYAETLLEANPNLYLVCVDPYLAYREYREHTSQWKLDDIQAEAQDRLRKYGDRCYMMRETSVEAARNWVNKLDFVYLDGNHSLPYVISDLHAWVPKVRKGGCIAGHDYIQRKNSLRYQCHVVEAVHAYTQCYMIHPWYVVGAKAEQEGVKRDSIRSFFWIKE